MHDNLITTYLTLNATRHALPYGDPQTETIPDYS